MDVKTVYKYATTCSDRRCRMAIIALLTSMVPETTALAQVVESAQNLATPAAVSEPGLGFSDILWPLIFAFGGFLYLTGNRTV